MISRTLTLPELGLIAGTRGMLGAGLGLLLADRLDPHQRRAAGWTLLLVGVATTIPLAATVIFGNEHRVEHSPSTADSPHESGRMAIR